VGNWPKGGQLAVYGIAEEKATILATDDSSALLLPRLLTQRRRHASLQPQPQLHETLDSMLDKIVTTGYDKLNLMYFFTTGEVTIWDVPSLASSCRPPLSQSIFPLAVPCHFSRSCFLPIALCRHCHTCRRLADSQNYLP